jgi:hypothetical protein
MLYINLYEWTKHLPLLSNFEFNLIFHLHINYPLQMVSKIVMHLGFQQNLPKI